eukprot:CAMPEP_0171116068 /NCGR_PEP_ID=MMETSP0766_2-20121228/89472_1 /TAXON_ID=439317 /ORGANISM="Gambierdiscus australes, Strain CAWD 149" /LENGTH=49 /DNA_ID= /DNA_START= /DNA_END= /DNA_ORIENTATION=
MGECCDLACHELVGPGLSFARLVVIVVVVVVSIAPRFALKEQVLEVREV